MKRLLDCEALRKVTDMINSLSNQPCPATDLFAQPIFPNRCSALFQKCKHVKGK